jgi:hypothetical protein
LGLITLLLLAQLVLVEPQGLVLQVVTHTFPEHLSQITQWQEIHTQMLWLHMVVAVEVLLV